MKIVMKPDSRRSPALQRSAITTTGVMPTCASRVPASVIARMSTDSSPSDESTRAGSRIARIVPPTKTRVA